MHHPPEFIVGTSIRLRRSLPADAHATPPRPLIPKRLVVRIRDRDLPRAAHSFAAAGMLGAQHTHVATDLDRDGLAGEEAVADEMQKAVGAHDRSFG